MSSPVIAADGLTCRFGSTVAVDGLTLEVGAGEVFALLGHNGAGKTTTIRAANGLVQPAAGAVRVFGLSPTDDGPALRRRTAVLTEASTLDERLTARELLATFAELYGVPRADAARRIGALLDELGLGGRADERVARYSKGMKQRLALARALVHRPDLLFLDEPTAGLDPAASRQLHDLVRRMSRGEGRTVVLCTHNLAEAQELCDRVAVLARGRLLAVGTPAELARRIAPSLELLVEVDPAQTAEALGVVAACDGMAGAPAGGGVIAVSGVRREQVPELVSRLAGAGVRLYRLVPREPTLADAYFALQADA